jgi:hypothetical protein
MHIFQSICDHFAGLLNQRIPTLKRKRPFWIRRVYANNIKANWVIILEVGQKHREQYIYITDVIKVYFWMLRHKWGGWVTLPEIHSVIDISKAQDTYIMALLATFHDIEARPDGSAIRFMPP